MKTHKTLSAFLLIIGSLIFHSCIKDDDFNFDKVASTTWNPDVAVPLIHSELTIDDIIAVDDSNVFSSDSNHFVTLTYRGNVYSMMGSEFLPVIDQNDFVAFNITSGDSTTLYTTNSLSKTITKSVPFIFPGGETIDSLNIKNGTLEVQINSAVPHPGTMNITIPNMDKNGSTLSFNVPFVASTGPQIITIDSMQLDGYFLDLSSSGVSNLFNIDYTAQFNNSNSSLSITDKNFDVTTHFKNINFSSIFGYVGVHGINLYEDSSRITLFDNFQSGILFFEDPKMTFTLSNSFGMPIDAHLTSFSALRKDGTSVPITGSIPDPLPIGYPTQVGQVATGSFSLDKTNSNIQYVISQAPRYIVYSLNASSNIPSDPLNFITDTSKLKADIRIDFPLRGHASGFAISDTADFTLEENDDIESAVFRINIDNGFPASAYTQVYFTDSNFVVLDSMLLDPTTRLVESAQIDANGKVTQSTHKMSDEPFSKTRLQHLYSTKKLIIYSIIDTKDAPTRQVEIYDYYKLDVKIGVRAQLNMKF